MKKIHLVPNAAGRKYAMCSGRVPESTRSVATREAFNALPREQRCGSCDAIVNGREPAIRYSTRVVLSHEPDRPEHRFKTTLAEFLVANEFSRREVREICARLAAGKSYRGGGGAAPIWTVEVDR